MNRVRSASAKAYCLDVLPMIEHPLEIATCGLWCRSTLQRFLEPRRLSSYSAGSWYPLHSASHKCLTDLERSHAGASWAASRQSSRLGTTFNPHPQLYASWTRLFKAMGECSGARRQGMCAHSWTSLQEVPSNEPSNEPAIHLPNYHLPNHWQHFNFVLHAREAQARQQDRLPVTFQAWPACPGVPDLLQYIFTYNFIDPAG